MVTTTKGSYDPVKVIEGMFNGSVTRIAYALKDPSDYSVSTKTVLAECAKKFHDALDDCEIQILDAKWYLEGQLRTNRLRREAKAREMGTAAKRKHDQIQDTSEPNTTEEVAAKKMKVDGKSEQKESTDQAKPTEQAQSKPVSSNTKEPSKATPTQQKSDKEEKSKESQPTTQNSQPSKPIPKPLPQSQPAAKSIEKSNPFETSKPLAPSNDQQSRQTQPAAPTADDFAKPTPQATPTGTNDDFFLESMFGEPMAEATGDGNKDGNDFEFDLTTGDLMGDAGDTGNQDPNSLDSFLPGLESYANQPDDNLLAMGLNTNTGTNTNNNTNSNNNNNNATASSNPQNTNILPTTSNDFDLPDLPDLGEPNVWDDLLNDDALNGGDMGVGNFDDNIDLTDSAFLDLDLDSFQ